MFVMKQIFNMCLNSSQTSHTFAPYLLFQTPTSTVQPKWEVGAGQWRWGSLLSAPPPTWAGQWRWGSGKEGRVRRCVMFVTKQIFNMCLNSSQTSHTFSPYLLFQTPTSTVQPKWEVGLITKTPTSTVQPPPPTWAGQWRWGSGKEGRVRRCVMFVKS